MRIRRIEVPGFRVLQNVEMEFDPAFDPQIFPIGSENGGGKSTLLQLVFALLHCSAHPERVEYLKNLLKADRSLGEESERLLARIVVERDGAQTDLHFVILSFDAIAGSMAGEQPEGGFGVLEEGRALERSAEMLLASFPSEPKWGATEVALVCRAEGLGSDDVLATLRQTADQVFLLGPSNQQYLFLPRASRKALVSASSLDYLTELNAAEAALPGFFAYDWLAFDPLVKLFAAARDKDFAEVVRTGAYGDHYTRMMADINGLLTGKTVRPLPDLDGVQFVSQRPDGAEILLGPEDLSRGELKRLMIYAWLKANQATDAVVLIDEIEASFHPDWQYRIIRDLQEWAPGNQYLLATHSYDLCEALTPAHVRALEPRLGARGEAADDA